MAHSYSIGRMAKETGCKVQTIRYYEQIGLLPAAMRTAGNQRVYSEDDRKPPCLHPPFPGIGFFISMRSGNC